MAPAANTICFYSVGLPKTKLKNCSGSKGALLDSVGSVGKTESHGNRINQKTPKQGTSMLLLLPASKGKPNRGETKSQKNLRAVKVVFLLCRLPPENRIAGKQYPKKDPRAGKVFCLTLPAPQGRQNRGGTESNTRPLIRECFL